jgi:hypothetical protein
MVRTFGLIMNYPKGGENQPKEQENEGLNVISLFAFFARKQT